MVSQLIARMADRNIHDFKVDNQMEVGQTHYFKSDFGLMNWVNRIYQVREEDPTVIIRQQYFVNIPALKKAKTSNSQNNNQNNNQNNLLVNQNKKIVWINFVRDPIEQFISQYYYKRNGYSSIKRDANSKSNRLYNENNLKSIDPKTIDLSLDECIKKKFEECLFPQSEFLSYFCGNTNSCRPKFLHSKEKEENVKESDLKYALNRAKNNIKSHYFIVGHLERIEEFIQFLHNSLPRYFRGAKFFYDRMTQNSSFYASHYDSSTGGRIKPNKGTYAFLREKLKYEIELFEFIKEEFDRKVEGFRMRFGDGHIAQRV